MKIINLKHNRIQLLKLTMSKIKNKTFNNKMNLKLIINKYR